MNSNFFPHFFLSQSATQTYPLKNRSNTPYRVFKMWIKISSINSALFFLIFFTISI